MGGQRWEVVGGADKGGILVRGGQSTTSEQLEARLATGALVEELELVGDRLHYQKVSGAGPETGWVSTVLKDKALLVHVTTTPAPPAAPSASSAVPTAAAALQEGDYYVTLGVLFKKPGPDPETEKILKLSRKVGALVHTTGKIWKSPKGGFWAELDTSRGDSGAGEKPGYVMVDASGFGTPGPCLQKAYAADGPPLLLRAVPPPGSKPWDGESSEKDFLVLQKTTVEDIRTIFAMLFGINKEGVSMTAPSGYVDGVLTNSTTVADLGLQSGTHVEVEVTGPKSMTLRVMSPLEEGVKLCDLVIREDWTVGQAKALLCTTTGLKKTSMLMAKGKMGERVGEDAQLQESKLVSDYGYKEGDEIAFIYMGDPAADLAAFLGTK